MRLSFSYADGEQVCVLQDDSIDIAPIEMNIQPSGNPAKDQIVLSNYLRLLEYAFKGVINATSGVVGVTIEHPWFGMIEKYREKVTWNAPYDKSFVISYSVNHKQIVENLYIADAVITSQESKKIRKKKTEPIINEDLLYARPELLKQNIFNMIVIASQHLTKTKVAWGYGGKEGLTVLNEAGEEIRPIDIIDDDEYILLELLYLISNRGAHLGVFLIDASDFSEPILNGFARIVQEFYGTAFLFYYNVPSGYTTPRNVIELRNIS